MGFLDTLAQDLANQSCSESATANQRGLDISIADVENTWHPTGFYTPDQMKELVTFALGVTDTATQAIRNALGVLQIEEHREMLADAAAAQVVVQQDATPFVDAIRQANNAGFQVIESTGLKRWVVRMLKAARDAHFAVAVVTCARPSLLLSIAGQLTIAVTKFVAFVKTVVGVAIDVVKAAGTLVLKIPDLLSSIGSFLKFLPWVFLLAGGYYVGVKTIIPPKYDPLKLRELGPWKR